MSSRPRTLPDPPPTFPSFPDWARLPRAGARAGEHADNAEFLAGAALSALHPVVKGDHPLGKLWRQRLALSSAEAVVKFHGRTEDAATLRDYFYLTRVGDDPGPAGRTLQAWRVLGTKAAVRSAQWQENLPALLQIAGSEETREAIDHALTVVAGQGSPVTAAANASASTIRITNSRPLALWLGDAVLALCLNWSAPVPLLAANLRRDDWRLASGQQADPAAWHAACAKAYARAAAVAVDLYADLARKAERLLAEAPKQRGKDTDEAVMALLSEDALAARAGRSTSDRSSRRLFDRLVELGAVRELTGRSTFRLYGL